MQPLSDMVSSFININKKAMCESECMNVKNIKIITQYGHMTCDKIFEVDYSQYFWATKAPLVFCFVFNCVPILFFF